MRISIIGQAGSGKSTLAKNISKKLNIPHFHLDRLWFESGAYKLKPDNKEGFKQARAFIKESVENFIKQDSWVSDGWYHRVQPIVGERADCIIFLDIPLYRRLLNHLQRIFKPGRHKELSPWDEVKFFYEMIYRTFVKGPKIRKFVIDNSHKVKIFKNYKEVDQYLKSLS